MLFRSVSQSRYATPHNQHNTTTLQLHLTPNYTELPLLTLINNAERTLGTPMQTTVKRTDEQTFTLTNGQNLIFYEDATRHLHRTLRQLPQTSTFYLKMVHAENLHTHDTIAENRWN